MRPVIADLPLLGLRPAAVGWTTTLPGRAAGGNTSPRRSSVRCGCSPTSTASRWSAG